MVAAYLILFLGFIAYPLGTIIADIKNNNR
jgi:hypothetical protein